MTNTTFSQRSLLELTPQSIDAALHQVSACWRRHASCRSKSYPFSSSFPMVDAVLVEGSEVTLIQITVAPDHRPTLEQAKSILGTIPKTLVVKQLVWVVNDDSQLSSWQKLAGQVTLDEYEKVAQFVCTFYVEKPICSVKCQNATSAICLPAVHDKKELVEAVRKLVDPSAKKITRFVQQSSHTNASLYSS